MALRRSLMQAIDLEKEIAAIERELRGAVYRDAVALYTRVAVTPDDLVRYIRSDRPNVIHFSGHGTKNGILLRSDQGGAATVGGDALARTFKGRDIDLVVLNGPDRGVDGRWTVDAWAPVDGRSIND